MTVVPQREEKERKRKRSTSTTGTEKQNMDHTLITGEGMSVVFNVYINFDKLSDTHCAV